MKAGDFLREAISLIEGDRERMHGNKADNFNAIAHVWNGILMASGKAGKPLDGHDVATLMEGMKIARRYTGELNKDDYLDSCGYASIAGELAQATILADMNLVKSDSSICCTNEISADKAANKEDNLIIFPVAPAVAD